MLLASPLTLPLVHIQNTLFSRHCSPRNIILATYDLSCLSNALDRRASSAYSILCQLLTVLPYVVQSYATMVPLPSHHLCCTIYKTLDRWPTIYPPISLLRLIPLYLPSLPTFHPVKPLLLLSFILRLPFYNWFPTAKIV